MPEHWLPLFDLAWEDGIFILHAVTVDIITATERDEFNQIMDLTFSRAEWYAQEEEEMPTRILFTEVLWENGKLRLNILTHTNEYSILAEDVKCVWVDARHEEGGPMSLEKSILNETILSDLLFQHYGISPVSVKKLKLGTANCFQVYDGSKYYFLKEFQSSFSEGAVVQEAKLLEFLSEAGIPTARFYKTFHNEFVINYQNHIICLEEYIEGQAFGYDDLPAHLLPKVGRMLGKLHQALKGYPLPLGMDESWLDSISTDSVIAQYDALIKIAESKADDDKIAQIIADLQYKKELAVRCEDYKKYYNGITYCSTHGDYQGCQLIWEKDEIKAVIDFSSASCLPVTWEIMRSFVQSSSLCRTTATIDITAFCEYVREYMKFSPLTKNDMLAMPYVYLFQLAQSKYGYPQYLNSDSEDREGLLRFAFWRTKMCREVEKCASEISDELVKLL